MYLADERRGRRFKRRLDRGIPVSTLEPFALGQLVIGPGTIGPGMTTGFDAGGILVGTRQFSIGPEPYGLDRRKTSPGGYTWAEEIRPIGYIDVWESWEGFEREAGAFEELKARPGRRPGAYLDVPHITPMGDMEEVF